MAEPITTPTPAPTPAPTHDDKPTQPLQWGVMTVTAATQTVTVASSAVGGLLLSGRIPAPTWVRWGVGSACAALSLAGIVVPVILFRK